MTNSNLVAHITEELSEKRLDVALSTLFSQYSRARLQAWIKEGQVQLDGEVINKPNTKVTVGQEVVVHTEIESQDIWRAQPIKLNIIYEDVDVIVINKPPGLVVHPGAGNLENTLLNALLHHVPELAKLPRAGIVHRLDKDTSGLLVIARTLEAHTQLVRELQERRVKREYEAVVCGVMISGGEISAPIGRHQYKRTHMAVTESGKAAVTHYRVIERFRAHTHIKVRLETGRTHQIRVHMAHLHFPIVGDQTYGGRLCLPKGGNQILYDFLRNFKRQALHAACLELNHPRTGELMSWTAPLPDDMQELLQLLREDIQ